ncbi:hypothetical protein D915_003401 [Fasciola hepatica]|uniref:Protein FAM184A/B N-terminal domain-containing protein n=1 Tax=Fasciola hepatica TaxID=6192 RepID=A0A4E0RUR1_FASHE|nr:hypothetical protein D915_003401 [Fasciola hepatica]
MPTATQSCPKEYTANQQDDGLSSRVHYCMSKKIAQLTKVIFILNTKNDEVETKSKEMIDKHKTEIERLNYQNATKLARHAELLEEEIQNRAKISKLESAVEQLRAEYDDREHVLQRSVEKSLITQEELKLNYKKQLDDLKELLLKTQEDHIRGSELAEETIQNWKQHQCPDTKPLLAEISHLRVELQKVHKEKDQVVARLEDAKHAITSDFQHQITRLSSEVSAKQEAVRRQESTIEVLSNQLVEAREELSRTLEQQKIRMENLTNDVRIQTETELNAKWKLLGEEESMRFEEELTRMHHILRASEEKWDTERSHAKNQLEKEKEKYEQVILEYDKTYSRLVQDNESCKNRLEKEEEQVAEMRKELDRAAEQHRSDKSKLETDCGILRRKVQGLEKLVNNLKKTDKENKESDQSEVVKSLAACKVQMENDISELKLKISTLEKVTNESKTSHQDAIVNLSNYIKQLRSTHTKLRENFTRDLGNHRLEIRQLQRKTREGIRKLKTYTKEQTGCSDQLQQEVAQILDSERKVPKTATPDMNLVQEERERSKRMMKKLNAEHLAEKMELQQQILRIEADREEALKLWEKERAGIKGQLKEQQSRNRTLDANLSELKKELDQARERSDQLETRIKLEKSCKFTDLTAQLDRKWAETVARECSRVREETAFRLAQAHEKQIEDLLNKNAALLMQTRDDCANTINELHFELHDTKSNQANNGTTDNLREVQNENNPHNSRGKREIADKSTQARTNQMFCIDHEVAHLVSKGADMAEQVNQKNQSKEIPTLNEFQALKQHLHSLQTKLEEKCSECKLLRNLLADAQSKIAASLMECNESSRTARLNSDILRGEFEEKLRYAKNELRQWYEARVTEETDRLEKMFEDQAKEYKISQKILKAKIQELLQRLSNSGQWSVCFKETTVSPSKSTTALPRLNDMSVRFTRKSRQNGELSDPSYQTIRRLSPSVQDSSSL